MFVLDLLYLNVIVKHSDGLSVFLSMSLSPHGFVTSLHFALL